MVIVIHLFKTVCKKRNFKKCTHKNDLNQISIELLECPNLVAVGGSQQGGENQGHQWARRYCEGIWSMSSWLVRRKKAPTVSFEFWAKYRDRER